MDLPGNIAVDIGRGSGEQDVKSSLKVLVLLAVDDGVAEELLEVLQRELVHRVDVAHVSYHKVQRRATHCHHAVPLTCHRDHLLRRFSFF